MTRIKVAIFLWWFQVGGTERHALRLARNLDRTAFDVELICWKADGQLAQAFQSSGLRIHVLRGSNRWSFLTILPRLVSLCRRRRFDVVHSLISFTLLLGPLAARIAKVPRVITSERNSFDWKLTGPRAIAARWVNRRLVDRIIVNSAAVGDRLCAREGLDRERVVVIPNGVELDGYALPDEVGAWRRRSRAELASELGLDLSAVPVVLMMASLAPIKGHRTLLAAAGEASGALGEAVLLMAGDGDERAALEIAARECGVGGRTHWLGRRLDPARVVAAADVLVVASTMEGFPNVVLEALAAGTPVVSSELPYLADLGPLSEYVRAFPVGDSAALAAALDGALTDEGWRARARERAPTLTRQRFGLDAEVQAHEAVYRGGLTREAN